METDLYVIKEKLYKNVNMQIEYGNNLLDYRRGCLVIKKRRNEEYYYLTYREKNKVKTDYLGKLTKPNVKKIQNELEEGTRIRNEVKLLQKEEKVLRKVLRTFDNMYLIKDVYDVMDIIVIIRPILKDFGVNKVYLYGSYAKGNPNRDSDINIYCDKPERPKREFVTKLEKELKKKVNVVTTSSKISDDLKQEIDDTKILIYGGY